jgi:hypothetical protein
MRLAAARRAREAVARGERAAAADFGREPDRLCVLELERSLETGASEPPDAPGELADAITAIRLATSAPVAAGRCCSSGSTGVRTGSARRADRRRRRRRASRSGSTRSARRSRRLLLKLDEVDDDPELGEAIDRWELSRFQDGPFQAEQLRESLAALLGGSDGLWAARCAAPCCSARRRAAGASCRSVCRAIPIPTSCGARSSRRSCTATARRWCERLDESILGLREPPVTYVGAVGGARLVRGCLSDEPRPAGPKSVRAAARLASSPVQRQCPRTRVRLLVRQLVVAPPLRCIEIGRGSFVDLAAGLFADRSAGHECVLESRAAGCGPVEEPFAELDLPSSTQMRQQRHRLQEPGPVGQFARLLFQLDDRGSGCGTVTVRIRDRCSGGEAQARGLADRKSGGQREEDIPGSSATSARAGRGTRARGAWNGGTIPGI